MPAPVRTPSPLLIRIAAVLAVLWVLVLVAAPWFPSPLAALVYAIGSLVCHQRPERSFALAAIQLPVCARCLGLYVGVALGAVAAPRVSPIERPRPVLLLASAPAVLSVLVEWSGAMSPSNELRALTGGVAGVVIAAVALATLHYEQCAPRRPIAHSPPPTHT